MAMSKTVIHGIRLVCPSCGELFPIPAVTVIQWPFVKPAIRGGLPRSLTCPYCSHPFLQEEHEAAMTRLLVEVMATLHRP
jgi:uncharacterized protein YbaR (Trm112 family)